MNILPALLVACTLIVLSDSGLAQNTKVYRCGPEGRELSQKPCDDGGQVLTPKIDQPDAEQRRQAAETAKRDAQLAKQMERDRRQREAENARQAQGAAGIHGRGNAAAEKPEKKPAKKAKAPAKPEGFTVTTPKPSKERKAAPAPKP
ncbi:MAG: hypothetical protein IV097_04490 [Burkholderiaceae bacterium]|nr:hypothetical protein [Burkholderiaceae bacterium]